jgi:replicative DNA helicase
MSDVELIEGSEQRLPPQSLDAERSALGAMMLAEEAVGLAIEILKTEQVFYRPAHGKIFKCILSLNDRSEPVDLLTLSEELQRMNVFSEIGGQAYLTEILNSVPTAANAEYHFNIVLEKYLYRQLIFQCNEIIRQAFTQESPVRELMDNAENRIYKLAEYRRSDSFQPLRSILGETIAKLERIHQSDSDITGIGSGFVDMDKLTAGFQNGDLVVLAGRPSMGKTAFGLNLARNAALDSHKAVAFFSLEMSGPALAQRLLTIEALVDAQKLRTGKLPENDWVKLGDAVGRLAEAPIYIDDTPAITVLEMRSKARRLRAENNIGMIVVDYLQMMEASTPSRNSENRQQEISQISRSLKSLAKELDVPVIALSQLSRAVENRPDKRPMLSDLRESGAIEQDADVVMFVYRPEYYKINEFSDGSSTENMAELIVGKQRNGPTGTVRLAFARNYGRFQDPAYGSDDQAYIPEDSDDVLPDF